MRSMVAAPRISRCTRFVRRPPCGGRRMECARREMCGIAAAPCRSSAQAIPSSTEARRKQHPSDTRASFKQRPHSTQAAPA
eukprot:8245753-Lingulodinium_polyedra.AAC.1